MLAYRDFAPQEVKGEKWYKFSTHENLAAALEAANAWLQETPVEIVQIETVVLPNVHGSDEEGTVDGALSVMGGHAIWHQFVRIWYREKRR